jgi:hypothetical protein
MADDEAEKAAETEKPTEEQILTEEERERIRLETILRAEVHREVAAAFAKKTGLFDRLNSPFVITFLGGVCITLAGQTFVRMSAESQQARAREEALFEKKVSIASAYANDIETANSLAGTIKKKRLWLLANPSSDARDDLGRSRAEMEKEFWETWKLYIQARKFASVITDVRSAFTSPAVEAAAQDLLKAYEAEQLSKTDAELEQRDRDGEKLVEKLSRAMSEEIHSGSR